MSLRFPLQDPSSIPDKEVENVNNEIMVRESGMVGVFFLNQ